jgi:hypothetical protein
MHSGQPKTRNAWLITWESSRDDYLRDLKRPRVVAILKPQISSATIKKILPILFTSESQLTFAEKINISLGRRGPNWIWSKDGSICCGHVPWLCARIVRDLYVQTYDDSCYHQTLHWTERSAQPMFEDVHFDAL